MESRREPPVLRFIRATLGVESLASSDAELLTRYIETGSHDAFEFLVWRHTGMVLRVCRSVTRDHHLAEDVAQAVFMALAKGARSILNRAAVAGWLHSVAWKLSSRAQAKLARKQLGSMECVEETVSESRNVADDWNEYVHAEIERLPERYRLPVLLCYFEGLTYAEAAKRLNWPIGTVNVRVVRAREILHRRLSRRGVVFGAAGIAGILSSAPELDAAYIAAVLRASFSFANSNYAPLGVSAFSYELARHSLGSTTLVKIVISAMVLVAGISILVAEHRSEEENSVEVVKSSVANFPSELKTFPVLAPVPKDQRPWKDVDVDTIKEFKKQGAAYGCLHLENRGVERGIGFANLKFGVEPGTPAPRDGIPGFSFPFGPGMGNKAELVRAEDSWAENDQPFPRIDVEFGLHLHRRHSGNAKCLNKLVPLKKLRLLILEGDSNPSSFATDLKEPLNQVRSLSIRRVNIKQDQFLALKDWSNLTELHLHQCEVDLEGFKMLSQLTNIRVLTITSCNLTDSGLARITSMPNLFELWLQERFVDNDGVPSFAAAKKLKNLTLYTSINTEGISKLPIEDQLEKFNMVNYALASNGRFRGLSELTISGGDSPGKLMHLQKLEHLSIVGKLALTPGEMEKFSQLKSLKRIDCSGVDTEGNTGTVEQLRKALPGIEITP